MVGDICVVPFVELDKAVLWRGESVDPFERGREFEGWELDVSALSRIVCESSRLRLRLRCERSVIDPVGSSSRLSPSSGANPVLCLFVDSREGDGLRRRLRP